MNALTRLFIRWSSEFAGLSFPTIDCAIDYRLCRMILP